MNDEQIREIADAILYEGYLLYPYRHSSIKNRQRWTFGVVYPRVYSATRGSNEPWQMRTECLVAGTAHTQLDVTTRFLHLLKHSSGEKDAPHGQRGYETWEEGRAREVGAAGLTLQEITTQARRIAISFPEEQLVEQDAGVVRVQKSLAGTMTVSAQEMGKGIFKLAVLLENTGMVGGEGNESFERAEVLLHSFVSTHTLLRAQQGEFISLLEPPNELAEMAQECQNTNTWPVLIGYEGEHDAMLSSPIILYDYPQIAPESIGTLFDGTEIDEILTLRIMTLTDEEKREMRKADERANALLERTESLTADDLMSLHGVIRNLHSVDEEETRR
ncbi:MAG: hypothetical protein NVS2B12_23980 [Ktedonobacteraceae bacterium]